MTQSTDASQAARFIIETLQGSGHRALLAGGCVRDRLLGRVPKDYDVATDAVPKRVCELFRRTKKVGAQFGVVLVALKGHDIEVATFRSDGEYRDGRRPESVTFSDAMHDAQRRDFTINGLFFDPVTDELVDHVGGQKDLQAKRIRCIGDPDQRFAEDHLRLLRAVRFAATLEFEIEPATFKAMTALSGQIAIISPERIRAELSLMLTSIHRERAWGLLCESGLVDHLIGGFAWNDAGRASVRATLAELPADAMFPLALAVIFSGAGSHEAIKACRRLRCSNEETSIVRRLIEYANQMQSPGALELADIKIMLASELYEQIHALAIAQARARSESVSPIDSVRARAAKIPTERIAPPPLLTGDFFLNLNVPQGPVYREILNAVYRAQLNESIETKSQAEAMGMKLLAKGSD
ncbi:MAG: CCA tRNA nucleotidyltransferase [Planctomycetes bacterium]|nr:CCA tRNA nucleotidyltransferase [Planctomycetota bacterium]